MYDIVLECITDLQYTQYHPDWLQDEVNRGFFVLRVVVDSSP